MKDHNPQVLATGRSRMTEAVRTDPVPGPDAGGETLSIEPRRVILSDSVGPYDRPGDGGKHAPRKRTEIGSYLCSSSSSSSKPWSSGSWR
jgi:hypothetical protein